MVSAGAGELPCLLAMDPGRAKCGLAVVRWDRKVLARQVVPSEEAQGRLEAWSREYGPRCLVLGDATSAREWRARLEAVKGLPPVVLVDEGHSSEE
nr:resolvase [Bacillota bacterium]